MSKLYKKKKKFFFDHNRFLQKCKNYLFVFKIKKMSHWKDRTFKDWSFGHSYLHTGFRNGGFARRIIQPDYFDRSNQLGYLEHMQQMQLMRLSSKHRSKRSEHSKKSKPSKPSKPSKHSSDVERERLKRLKRKRKRLIKWKNVGCGCGGS